MSTSYGLIFELVGNEKLRKYRIILSHHTSYLHKWLVHFLICLLLLCLIFLQNVCKPRTTTFPLWQPSSPELTFYGSELANLPSRLGIVNADWLCSMRSEIFLQMKSIIFQGCLTKLAFYLGSLIHIISSLFSHFRSWDYLEHFGIYSQLDRKSKTWLSFSSMCMFPESHRTNS